MKQLIKVLVLCLLLVLIPVSAFAETTEVASGECGETATWVLDLDGVLKISGSGNMYNFQSIDAPWSSYNENIVEIIVDGTINNVGQYAFYNMPNLETLTINEGVTRIENYAVSSCEKLVNISLPSTLEYIGSVPFYDCAYESITIPKNVKRIGENPFAGTDALKEIIVDEDNPYYYSEDGVLFKYGVADNDSILVRYPVANSRTSYTTPDNVAQIGSCAFQDCTNLESVVVSDGVKIIKDHAFGYCENLSSIELADSIEEIGYSAFYDCIKLENIDLPSNLKKIGSTCFQGCTKIKNISLPDSLETIDYDAFSGISITEITIPENVSEIGHSPFQNCSSLKYIDVADGNKYFYSDNGVLIRDTEEGGNVVTFPAASDLESYTIPDHVSCIDFSAFSESGLKEIIMPDTVTEIQDFAFNDCTELTNMKLSDTLTYIGTWGFAGCNKLSAIYIPKSIQTIDYAAFDKCPALTDVYYSGTEEEWKAIVIEEKNEQLLNATIHYNATDIPDDIPVISGTFGDNFTWTLDRANGILTINGTGKMDDYDKVSDTPWNEYEGAFRELVIEEGITSIGDHAFERYRSIEKVELPESLKDIGRYSFAYCSKLNKIQFPNALENIDGHAFYMCSDLCELYIPENLSSIAYRAFSRCDKLNTIKVASNNQYFYTTGADLLARGETGDILLCYATGSENTNYTIPDRVSIISPSVFSGSRNLKTIFIPENVTRIEENPFSGCENLEAINVHENNPIYQSIDGVLFTGNLPGNHLIIYPCKKSDTTYTIPEGITDIQGAAFVNCKNLISITIPEGINVLNEYTFDECYGLQELYLPASLQTIAEGAFFNCFNLTNVYYNGDDTKWSAVEIIEFGNEELLSATIHFVTPSADDTVLSTLESLYAQENLSAEDVIAAVKEMNANELMTALSADNQSTGVAKALAQLEEKFGLTVAVELKADTGFTVDTSKVSVVGAGLNTADTVIAPVFTISKPVTEPNLPEGYTNAIWMDFSLSNVDKNSDGTLAVPIRITMPVPDGLNTEKLRVLHYKDDGSIEAITPYVYQDDSTYLASFTVNSLSPFAFVEVADETNKTVIKGDVDQNTDVNMDDVVALLNHVVKAETIDNPDALAAGEVTNDTELNMDDVVKLLNYVVKAIDSLD